MDKVTETREQTDELCKAGGKLGKNYNKPHVWVAGMFNGKPRESCRFCGRWAK